MTDTTTMTVLAERRGMRCFPCATGNHPRCLGDPCECVGHWPAQADVDPLDGPLPPSAQRADSA